MNKSPSERGIHPIYEKTTEAWQMIYQGKDKILKCIKSSNTVLQFETCANMIRNFREMVFSKYGIPKDGFTEQTVLQRIGFWKEKDVARELICEGMKRADREMVMTLTRVRKKTAGDI